MRDTTHTGRGEKLERKKRGAGKRRREERCREGKGREVKRINM